MRTYVFKFEVEQDQEGYWKAEIPTLPGCATWGHSQEEALEVLALHQQPLPQEAEAEAIIISDADVDQQQVI